LWSNYLLLNLNGLLQLLFHNWRSQFRCLYKFWL
jgi:hypothetical protein